MGDYSIFLEEDGFAIYLFHGVISKNHYRVRNYTSKHLLLDKFVSVLEGLCRYGVAVSMRDIVEATIYGGALPQRAFAITFDDGFENNYSVVAPVLRDLKIPATFYVTTDFIESNSSSWIDMIEYAFEKLSRFDLQLPFLPTRGYFETSEEKCELLEQIRKYVKTDPSIDPYEFARNIWNQLGVKEMIPDLQIDQKMSWEQLRELSRDRLFSIGGHGHTHRILAYLSRSELDNEVAVTVEKLRKNLGVSVEHFSYPEGFSNCYSSQVIDVLRAHGVVCSPTAEHGTNRVGDDLFRLKRIMVV